MIQKILLSTKALAEILIGGVSEMLSKFNLGLGEATHNRHSEDLNNYKNKKSLHGTKGRFCPKN